jgi:transposase InsO family protein
VIEGVTREGVMPFLEKTIVDIREQMVLAALEGRTSVTEVAELFGVSRPTVRLWRERYRQQGRPGLEDRSHATRSCPHRTGETIEELIVKEREQWGWGSKKLLERLKEKHPKVLFPPRSTVDAILARHNLVRIQKRRTAGPGPVVARYDARNPAELTTIDYKGHFRLRSGRYCYPLTLMDAVSRYLLACEALPTTDFEHAWPVIERVFREHGLPEAMQSDNGPPFGSSSGRFSTMSVTLMSLGVQPVFSRPGKPQDNGRHERMHRDLKADIVRHRGSTLREQQKFFDSFRRIYNVERPHEGIDLDRPARRFRSSPRPFPRRPPEPDYAAHWEKRRVMSNGVLRWHSKDVFLSEAFGGHTVGFEPFDCDLWRVRFHRFIIGTFDERTSRIS